MSWETPERSFRCDARMLKRDDKLVCLPSHGENRGSSPLGSANAIKYLIQVHQLVSNNCPINVCGQAWTACRFLDWTTCAVRVVLPLRSWRHPAAGAFMWNRRMCWCDVVANAAASAGSYGQRIVGKRCANRYPTLEIPTQYIFGACLTAKRAGS